MITLSFTQDAFRLIRHKLEVTHRLTVRLRIETYQLTHMTMSRLLSSYFFVSMDQQNQVYMLLIGNLGKIGLIQVGNMAAKVLCVNSQHYYLKQNAIVYE